MKHRKSILVVFLLTAAMLMSVGYAALTDTLTIIGNAHVDVDTANKTFDERIKFTAADAIDSTGTGTTADVASYTADDATYTVNRLAVMDEYSVFTFTIKNESNVDAEISVGATKLSGDTNPSNSNTNKFDVQYKYFKSAGNEFGEQEPKVIGKNGGTMIVQVTVTLKEPVTSATSATFGIELTATSVEPTPVEPTT